jgi:glycosyltransferase involved in cell wall biosynthesis
MPPEVSVVTATYHRPAALRVAIQSVLRQTFADWELIVVGDGCTDDTAGVVAAFAAADPRVRFVNLGANSGDQAIPNNVGVALARGRCIAFLNHDDLYWPDHLARGLAALERTGADLVFSRLLVVGDGANHILGGSPAYDPNQLVPASAWIGIARAMRDVGPWRSGRELHGFPSQEWLFRAHRAGVDARWSPRWILRRLPTAKRIVPTGELTVVHISSVLRPGMYRDPGAAEQERWARLIADGAPRDLGVGPPREPRRRVADRARALLVRTLLAAGVAPMATRMYLEHHGRRGEERARLRRRRGLL